MKRIILYLLPAALFMGGCLQDNIIGPQKIARPVNPPTGVYYLSVTGTLNLQILWNPPLADTQQNFKGYFIELFNSTPYIPLSSDGIDSIYGQQIDSAHVPKIDTNYTFMGKVVQGGRYTVRIWGERFPDPTKPDSVVLSQFYASLSFNFDSRPVYAPTEIYASSAGPTTVNLFWGRSANFSDTNVGMAGYIIRYQDPLNNASHVAYYTRLPFSDTAISSLVQGKYNYAQVTLPGNTSPPFEKEYTIWVKAIRRDSVESADSIGITWSGAERFGPLSATLDTGIFIGQSNFNYTMTQIPLASAQFQVTQSGANFVIVSQNNNTQFASQVDIDSTLDRSFPKKVFMTSDFNQTQISFPSNSPSIIYALFNGGGRARLLFLQGQDTVTHLITNQIQASFQPIEPSQLPFF
jgi:hypothetical protein